MVRHRRDQAPVPFDRSRLRPRLQRSAIYVSPVVIKAEPGAGALTTTDSSGGDNHDSDKSAPFRFLDLPSELRQMVYRELLCKEGRTSSVEKKLYPQILSTCQIVSEEAYGVLWGENTWYIWLPHMFRQEEMDWNMMCVYGGDLYWQSYEKWNLFKGPSAEAIPKYANGLKHIRKVEVRIFGNAIDFDYWMRIQMATADVVCLLSKLKHLSKLKIVLEVAKPSLNFGGNGSLLRTEKLRQDAFGKLLALRNVRHVEIEGIPAQEKAKIISIITGNSSVQHLPFMYHRLQGYFFSDHKRPLFPAEPDFMEPTHKDAFLAMLIDDGDAFKRAREKLVKKEGLVVSNKVSKSIAEWAARTSLLYGSDDGPDSAEFVPPMIAEGKSFLWN